MVRFRALKFVLLSLRQLTKPCVQSIISRASHERPLTRHVCTSLGRFSLALSAVTAEWGRREEANRMSSLENADESTNDKSTYTFKYNQSEPSSSSSSSSSSTSTNTVNDDNNNNKGNVDSNKSKTKTESSESSFSSTKKQAMETHSQEYVAFNEDLLQFMRDALGNNYNKQIDEIAREAGMQMNSKHIKTTTLTQEVDSSDRNETSNEEKKENTEEQQRTAEAKNAEVNERNSEVMSAPHETGSANKGTSKRYSSWYVFRQTYHAPFPSQLLLNAGADLLIELLVYVICIFLLFIEVRQETLIATRREINARIAHGQLADKINEIIQVVKNESTYGVNTSNTTDNMYRSSSDEDEESIDGTVNTAISFNDNSNSSFTPVTRETLKPLMMEEYQMDKRIERHSLLKSLTFLLF